MNFKKHFLAPIILLAIFLPSTTFAVEPETSKVVTSTATETEVASLDRAKDRIGEILEILENTRLHYAEYFLKIRNKNKMVINPIEIGDLDKQPKSTDVAGVENTTDGVKMPNTTELKDNFVEYAMYFLSSSLYSFFNNKPMFYVGLVLFILLSLRFILRRFL